MREETWLEFIYRAVGTRPVEPEQYQHGSKEYVEAKVRWDAWHSYVEQIVRLARDPRTEGLVLYRNVQFDSSAFGQVAVMCYGKSRTHKNVEECAAGHLNDLPSERLYPQSYVDTRDKAKLTDVAEALAVPLDD